MNPVRALRLQFLAATLPLALAACGDSGREFPVQELLGSTMGTTFSVKIVAPHPELDLVLLQRDIQDTLDAVNQLMSTYMEASALSEFNASESVDWQEVPADLCHAVEAAQVVSEFTDGAFDITVGPLVDLWGFGPADSGPEDSEASPPTEEDIATTMTQVGYRKLHVDCSIPAMRKDSPGLRIDLSAFAKGHAVDLVADLLDARDLPNYLVEIGGEMRMRGINARSEPWAIAVETPTRQARNVQTVVNISNSGMATSGDYRNYFEHEGQFYSHTIDPRTGSPIRHEAASVTVIADTAAFADAAATALLVLGPQAGLELAERESIAAYFLLRLGDKFDERMSPLFASKVHVL